MDRSCHLTIFSMDYKCNSLATKPASPIQPCVTGLGKVKLSQAGAVSGNPPLTILFDLLETAIYLHGTTSCISLSGTISRKSHFLPHLNHKIYI